MSDLLETFTALQQPTEHLCSNCKYVGVWHKACGYCTNEMTDDMIARIYREDDNSWKNSWEWDRKR